MDENTLLLLCKEKAEQNKTMLVRTCRVEYKRNMIDFITYHHILSICITIKACIASIASSELAEYEFPSFRDTRVFVDCCSSLPGMAASGTYITSIPLSPACVSSFRQKSQWLRRSLRGESFYFEMCSESDIRQIWMACLD